MLNNLNEQPLKPNRVVVLGAKGFVGSATGGRLVQRGIDTLLLGREDLDLLEDTSVEALAQLLLPTDSVVVISAQAPVKDNSMLLNNIRMMSHVCGALERVPPAYVIYVSSDAVYADTPEPLTEASCAEPGSLHGAMHLAREIMLSNSYEGPLGIIRPTLIYGHTDPHNGYGPNRFRRLAAKGEDIVLFGEGEERRDHILIDDVAELIIRMLEHKSYGKLNAATGEVKSFREIAKTVVSLFNEPVKIVGSPRVGEMPHNGYRPFDPKGTYTAFPEFRYTDIQTGLTQVHEQMTERANAGN